MALLCCVYTFVGNVRIFPEDEHSVSSFPDESLTVGLEMKMARRRQPVSGNGHGACSRVEVLQKPVIES